MVQGRAGAEVALSPSALTQVWLAFKGGNNALLKQMAKSNFSCSAPLHLHLNPLIPLQSEESDEKSKLSKILSGHMALIAGNAPV